MIQALSVIQIGSMLRILIFAAPLVLAFRYRMWSISSKMAWLIAVSAVSLAGAARPTLSVLSIISGVVVAWMAVHLIALERAIHADRVDPPA